MIPYMVGQTRPKLNSFHQGVVESVPGRGFFRAAPPPPKLGDNIETPPSHSMNDNMASLTLHPRFIDGDYNACISATVLYYLVEQLTR